MHREVPAGADSVSVVGVFWESRDTYIISFLGIRIRNSLHVVKSSSSIGLQFTLLHNLLGEPTVVAYNEVVET